MGLWSKVSEALVKVGSRPKFNVAQAKQKSKKHKIDSL